MNRVSQLGESVPDRRLSATQFGTSVMGLRVLRTGIAKALLIVTCTLSCDDPQVRNRPGSYTAYSVGCAVVWAVILAALAATGKREKLRAVLPVCGGLWIGWTSATIARYVYPPPKSRPPWTRNRQS